MCPEVEKGHTEVSWSTGARWKLGMWLATQALRGAEPQNSVTIFVKLCRQWPALRIFRNIQTSHKMPQSIEPNKKKHDEPYHHPVMSQFWRSFRSPVSLFENLLKPYQVQKFDHRQQTAKRTQSFAADPVGCGSRDFTGLGSPARKPFVYSRFCVIMLSPLNHLGYLLFNEFFSVNPIIIGNSDGFLLYSPVSMQNSGITKKCYVGAK